MKSIFKRYFITGLLILVPIVVTWLVLLRLMGWLYGVLDFDILPASIGSDRWALLPDIAISAINTLLAAADFGLAVLMVILVVLFTGMIGRALVVKRLINFGERILTRVPLVGIIYRSSKQLMEAFFTPGKSHFNRVVLIEYPRAGLWSLAFVSSDTAPLFNDATGLEMINVFVPTTPNPTSGYLLMVPMSDARNVNLSIEEAFKVIISAGVVRPLENV